MKRLLFLFLFLTGCAASPYTNIRKEVIVCAGGDVLVNYITNVDIKIDANTKQDLKDLFKAVPIR